MSDQVTNSSTGGELFSDFVLPGVPLSSDDRRSGMEPGCHTTDYETILRFLNLLHPNGTRFEVRWMYRTRTTNERNQPQESERVCSQRFDNHESGARSAAERSNQENTVAVWVTINPINPEIPWNQNQKATGERNITLRTAFFIDFDNQRPTKTNATDAERQASEQLARECREWLSERGFPEPIFSDSGNGHHLLYKTDLPADDGGLVKQFLLAVAGKFDTDTVKIDTGVHNPARVCKVPGTCARKGKDTPDRPHRMADILEAPNCLEPVPRELLEQVASEAPVQNGRQTRPGRRTHQQDARSLTVNDERHQRLIDAVLMYLDRVGVGPVDVNDKEDMTVISLPCCPFKTEGHTVGGAGILIYRSGDIAAKCFHEKCEGKGWRAMQEAWRNPISDFAKEIATKVLLGSADREYSDPLVLAETHNKKWSTDDGTLTLACFGEDTYRYSDEEGWLKTTAQELAPWVRETAQCVFDEHAWIVSALTGNTKPSKPVRGNLVPDTIRAMQSICKYGVPANAQPPFWLEKDIDWDPDDLLVFHDCVLNVRHYLEERDEYLRPRTPKLFYEYQANFDFDPQPPRPNEWFNFLESLERPNDWIDFLQQVMGYCLWPGWDLQKFFMLVGPPRSGKGTITKVLENLVGGERAVCSPGLRDFASPFGLEQAIGKRLAFVPEIRLPRDNHAEIVAHLKAITGGDLVTVNRKHIANVPMRLKMKIIMSTNNFVALPDNSGALHARVLPLKLTKSFVGKEDTKLADKLVLEYPGILRWALEGLRKLCKANGRFAIAESTQDELDQLLAGSAPLQVFIEQCCEVNSTKGVQTTALYKIYKTWFESENPEDTPLRESQFADELRTAIHSVTGIRASTPNQRQKYGHQIVETDHDADPSKRPQLWLGICPKPEVRNISIP